MAYGYPQQPEKVKKATGKFHHPDEEVLKELGNRAYKLKPYQKKNIEEISRRLTSGQELNKDELENYQSYLEKLSYELKEILQEEQAEKISNLPLEKDLRKVAQLLGQVTTILERY